MHFTRTVLSLTRALVMQVPLSVRTLVSAGNRQDGQPSPALSGIISSALFMEGRDTEGKVWAVMGSSRARV